MLPVKEMEKFYDIKRIIFINRFAGWIFPGYSKIDQNLPERTTLHRKLKEHLMSGKKFGIASGHLVIDRIEIGM